VGGNRFALRLTKPIPANITADVCGLDLIKNAHYETSAAAARTVYEFTTYDRNNSNNNIEI